MAVFSLLIYIPRLEIEKKLLEKRIENDTNDVLCIGHDSFHISLFSIEAFDGIGDGFNLYKLANATCEIEQLIKCRIFKSFVGKSETVNIFSKPSKSFKPKNLCLFDVLWKNNSLPRRLCVVLPFEWKRFHGFKKLNLWQRGAKIVRFVTLDQSKTLQCMRLSRLYRVFHVNFSLSLAVCALICETLKNKYNTMLTWLECYPCALIFPPPSRAAHLFLSPCAILTLSRLLISFVCLFLYDLIRSLIEYTV